MPVCRAYFRALLGDTRESLLGEYRNLEAAYKRHFAGVYSWGNVASDTGPERTRPFRQRPKGMRLSTSLELGDLILIPNFFRAFQRLADLVDLIGVWKVKQVTLVVLEPFMSFDLASPTDAQTIALLAAAELDRLSWASNPLEQVAQRRAQGLPASKPPFGFRLVGPKAKRRLIPCKYTHKLALILRQWHDELGLSIEDVVIECRKQRIMTQPGGSKKRKEISFRFARQAIELGGKLKEAAAESATAAPVASALPTSSPAGGNHQ